MTKTKTKEIEDLIEMCKREDSNIELLMEDAFNRGELVGARKYRDTIRRGMKDGYTNEDVLFIREVNKDDND